MFKSKFNISNPLLANIKRITSIVTVLNNQGFSDIVLARLEKRAREISAFSSTSIEGNPLPLTDVRRILKNKPAHIRDSEKEVLNYNKALVKLNNLIKNNKQVFNLSLILEIQKIVTEDLIEKYRWGKLRQEPVFVNDPKTRQAVYLPPEHSEVPILMKELLEYVAKNEGKIDPLILAGIFHKQFVIIHPFVDGNGRTARLATKILLAKMGLDTFNLFSFENYYNQNVSKYFKKVGLWGNYYDMKSKINFTAWLEYFTDGIVDELLRVEKEMDREAVSPRNELKDHDHKIITHIKKNGYINNQSYAKLTDRAKSTRSLDLKKLVALGIIKKIDKGKATYYELE